MHPFLDVSSLTDDEIIERLGKAYQFMNMQKQLGHTPAVQSIKEVIESLEVERQNRMRRMIDDEHAKKNPNALNPIDIGTIEE